MTGTIAIQLGRLGDLVNILPACRHLGVGRVMCCEEFLPALRGQSYVEPVVWHGHQQDTLGAIRQAQAMAERVVVPQMDGNGRNYQPARWRPSYVQDQWDRLQPGFGDQWGTLPLEYDQRDLSREMHLVRELGVDGRTLLVNLRSCSSPFDAFAGPGGFDAAARHIAGYTGTHGAKVVWLEPLRVARLCDMLGLFEVAAGMIVADTMPLHLARATPTLRTFQFTRPDKDCTPLRGSGQPYAERTFGLMDRFVEQVLTTL